MVIARTGREQQRDDDERSAQDTNASSSREHGLISQTHNDSQHKVGATGVSTPSPLPLSRAVRRRRERNGSGQCKGGPCVAFDEDEKHYIIACVRLLGCVVQFRPVVAVGRGRETLLVAALARAEGREQWDGTDETMALHDPGTYGHDDDRHATTGEGRSTADCLVLQRFLVLIDGTIPQLSNETHLRC